MKPHLTPIERFWTKVNKDGPIPPHANNLGPCWEWIGVKNSGYGTSFYYRRRGDGAHRVSYFLHYGIPDNLELCVLHKCDNPACVNPTHLFLGTKLENMQDCARKGRLLGQPNHKPNLRKRYVKQPSRYIKRGYSYHAAKLSQQSVQEIRTLHTQGNSYRHLAKQYNVSLRAIACVIKRITWQHVL